MGISAKSLLNRLVQNIPRRKTIPKNPNSTTITTTTPSSPSSILAHLDSGRLSRAVSALYSSRPPLPPSIYARLFAICISPSSLVPARKVEFHLLSTIPHPPTFLLNRAIEAYSRCGSITDARELFDEMPHRDGGTWNSMLASYSTSGQPDEALALFVLMHEDGVRANEVTLACVLGCCASARAHALARQLHGLLVKGGLASNVVLGSSLVDVYGKCLGILDARRAFDDIPSPNAVSWNVLVRRNLEAGEPREAVMAFFRAITESDAPLLTFTFSSALVACADVGALDEGRQIHGTAIKSDVEGDRAVATSLVEMYAKCGALGDARRLFERTPSRDVVLWTSIVSGYASRGRVAEAEALFVEMPVAKSLVTWNAMLSGYVCASRHDRALDFAFEMLRAVTEVDHVSLRLILNACAGLACLEIGEQVHAFVYRHGYDSNRSVNNALLDMYGKCGALRSAESWFFAMGCQRDRVSWNSLISGFARHKRSEEALDVFVEMRREATPNEVTFSTIFAACANVFALREGKQIHAYMIRNNFETGGVIVRGALVDMYSKCRCLDYAGKVFDAEGSRDIILWNSFMLGCAYNGRGDMVLDLFELMQNEGVRADNVTFMAILLGCICEGFVDAGRGYFDRMSGEFDVMPQMEHYECMIELFGRHGRMGELEEFVNRMPFDATVPMWTRVFDCCREYGDSRLGEWAAKHLNESNPATIPVKFDVGNYSN
ncbi:Pentatricopeptide repeat-containing protein [Acorus gramineus]|uniref:Pentatricopeptide repeat-containing protein n=1 Tax=Acorus gramineus TaxID=55184 RepID=A0AAV9AMP4_ACOGR|nr:Pentatricopeptide repeat-containing protein [Acorus gramineus]